MVRVSLVQLRSHQRPSSDQPRGFDQALAAIERAALDGAELVLLPELWQTGPFELDDTFTLAGSTQHEFLTTMSAAAAQDGIWLLPGTFLEVGAAHAVPHQQPTHRPTYNTAVLFDPDGNEVARYRKRHLFGFDIGEAAVLDAGDEFVVVDTPMGRTGLATCYDLRFPEHFRSLVEHGAETVLIPTGWPTRRIGHWRTLAAARAIENQQWILGCNGTGFSGEVELGGDSLVVDPWGNAQVLPATDQTAILTVDLDPAMPARTRAEFPVLRDRRSGQ